MLVKLFNLNFIIFLCPSQVPLRQQDRSRGKRHFRRPDESANIVSSIKRDYCQGGFFDLSMTRWQSLLLGKNRNGKANLYYLYLHKALFYTRIGILSGTFYFFHVFVIVSFTYQGKQFEKSFRSCFHNGRSSYFPPTLTISNMPGVTFEEAHHLWNNWKIEYVNKN